MVLLPICLFKAWFIKSRLLSLGYNGRSFLSLERLIIE
jgi:hypothetical protein